MSKKEKGKAGPWEEETTQREENHLVRLDCGISSSREEDLRKTDDFQKECIPAGLEPGEA